MFVACVRRQEPEGKHQENSEVAKQRNQPPSEQHSSTIEFVGGPFDGHRQAFAFSHEELSEVVMLPVNRNMLRMVKGQQTGPRAAASSVAVYELIQHEHGPRYVYWLSAAPQHLQLEDWLA